MAKSYEDLREALLTDDRNGSNIWRNERLMELFDNLNERLEALEPE